MPSRAKCARTKNDGFHPDVTRIASQFDGPLAIVATRTGAGPPVVILAGVCLVHA